MVVLAAAGCGWVVRLVCFVVLLAWLQCGGFGAAFGGLCFRWISVILVCGGLLSWLCLLP